MKKTRDPAFRVVVEYPGGGTAEYDNTLRRIARRENGGSGYCLFSGYRDLSFDFHTARGALSTAKRIREMRPKKKGTRVKVWAYTSDLYAKILRSRK